MRAIVLLLALAAFGACATPLSPALATTPTSPVENCLTRAGDEEPRQTACIGQFASSCIETTPGGETSVGVVGCVESELAQWENARGALVNSLRADESPTQVALLDASLAEHRRWAQARCAYEASVYEGGSLARIVAAHCMRDAVAEHTIYLLNRYSDG